MGVAELGRRRRFAPPSHARIDWSHPLAQGLAFCWLASRPSQDLAGSGRATAGGVPTADSPWGAAVLPSTSSHFFSFPRGKVPAASALTAVVAHTYLSGAGGKIVTIDGGAGDTPQLVLVCANTTAVSGGVGGTPYSVYATDPSAPTAGGHVAAITWTGGGSGASGTVAVWNDGVLRATSTGTSGTQSPVGIEIGRYNSTFNQQYGNPISSVFIYPRVLNAAELVSLHADPFQFLAW